MSGGATQVRRVKIYSHLTVPMKQTFLFHVMIVPLPQKIKVDRN